MAQNEQNDILDSTEHEASLTEEEVQIELKKKQAEAEELLQDYDKVEQFLQRLERKLLLIPCAGKYLADVPILISLVRAYINKEYTQVPAGSIIAVVGALIYVLSPIDLIPDAIPVAGYSDDAIAVGVVMKLIHDDLEEYMRWQVENGKRDEASLRSDPPKGGKRVKYTKKPSKK